MEAGTTLKHYRILSKLGEGGMGTVYRAEDTRLGRHVALKVLRPDLTVSPERLQRFEREARAASAISHPNVATLYDIHYEGETVFLTMEYVEGKNLRQLIESGPLPLPQLLDCLVQVGEAMGAAHQKGVVHRDLKLENVMAADSGFYKILDFGLARMALREDSKGHPLSEREQTLTLSRDLSSDGQISGTVAYMSPEQIQGEAVGARSDIFSFGILLYELATGVSPFKGKNLLATYHGIVHEQPPPIASLRPGTPPELDRIASRCLAKAPSDRYQTAADLVRDLRALKRDSDSGSMPRFVSPADAQGISAPDLAVGTARGLFLRPRTGWILLAAAGLVIVSLCVLYLGRPRGSGIRAGSGPRAGAETLPGVVLSPPARTSTSPAAPSGRRIAVAPFANRSGDAGADWLRQGLPEMLTTDLARVPGLQMISSQRIQDLLAAAGKEAVEDLDRGASAQLGRYAGAGVVVNGTIFKVGKTYRVDVQAFDTATGEVLTAHRAEGTDLFKIADELGAGLKTGLQLGAPGQGGPQLVATSSPEAYRFYSEGLKEYQALHFAQAAEAFRNSLRLDPEFASSQLRLGMSLILDEQVEAGMSWVLRAVARPERLAEREQALASMIEDAYTPGGREKTTAPEEPSDRYAKDPEILLWRAKVLMQQDGKHVEAIRLLHKALAQDPNDALAITSLVLQLQDLGMSQDADEILQDFRKRSGASVGDLQPPRPPLPPASTP